MSGPSSGAEPPRQWPNPATVLKHADRALEALQRAEEEVRALLELCRPASDAPANPGPVGSASVLRHIWDARRFASGWAATAAAAVQHELSPTPAASGDAGSAPSL